MSETCSTQLPTILTANTYFWSPAGSAAGRRSNEKRQAEHVEKFFLALGFAKIEDGVFERDNLRVEFSYSESCHNVYKRLVITRNGKRSNITAIKKLIA